MFFFKRKKENSEIKSVSIQSDLNGLTFFDTNNNIVAKYSSPYNHEEIYRSLKKLKKLSPKVKVIVTNDMFFAIPTNLYVDSNNELYFKAKSMDYDISKFQYKATRYEEYTILIAFELYLLKLIESLFTRVSYTHPLMENLKEGRKREEKKFFLLWEMESRVALTLLIDKKLVFSEFLPISAPTDLLYYIERVAADNKLRDFVVLFKTDIEEDRSSFDLLNKKIENVYKVDF